MSPRILQYVAERVARLRWRREDLHVVAVVEHAARATEVTVEAARHPHRPALNASRERGRVARLADQVDVIALDRELADPKLILATAMYEGVP